MKKLQNFKFKKTYIRLVKICVETKYGNSTC